MPTELDFPAGSRSFGGPAYIRRDLRDIMPTYRMIRDCMTGSRRIKMARTTYLPRPFPASDTSKLSEQRYHDYLRRAVFYNVAKRTETALVGEIFGRDPQIVLPPGIEAIEDNISGDGLDINQVARVVTNYALTFGRAGLLVDYPSTDGMPTTQEQILTQGVQPVIVTFAPWQVVNWRTMIVGTKEVLCLVVLYEGFGINDDGFETKLGFQYRELRLDPATLVYNVNIWRRNYGTMALDGGMPTSQGLGIFQSYTPQDASGNVMHEIPFHFVGSDNNNPNIDEPPMYDLCELNIAHYRNSADYEELVFKMGQPTQYFTGLDQAWVNDYLENKVYLGSGSSIPLPVGATAGMLQITPNGTLKEAMDQKERQMAALGAKLTEQKQIQRTATEAAIEDSAENSALGLVATNVSAGMTWALETCCLFTGDDPSKIEYELNTSFDLAQLDPGERLQLMKEWQAGGIAWEEYRAQLRKAGIASMPDEEAQEAIQAELAASYGGQNPLIFDTLQKPPAPTPGNGPAPTAEPPGDAD